MASHNLVMFGVFCYGAAIDEYVVGKWGDTGEPLEGLAELPAKCVAACS